ncbi:MAG: Replication factor C small subunit [Candidatus Bathyarchaeota archaeon BA1]|nr:MAG: Replication factor C small subunit [Candidatus Bathyarchaeota archaeon BA1]
MWAVWRPDAISVLKDRRARASLARYFDVMQNDKPAKFLIAKKLPAHYNDGDPLPKLWETHEQLTEEFYRLEKEIDSHQKSLEELNDPQKSYLDLKIEIANRILESCHLCTRRCGFNRLAGELGYCKCGTQILVSTMFEHMGEEPELVPSGTIFTLGCSMRCLHCQNWSICLTGNSLVPLADGSLVKISELVNDGMRKGDMEKFGGNFCTSSNLDVLTVNSDGKIVVDKCDGLSKRKASVLIEIITKTGRKITVTPNHSLYLCFNGVVLPVAAERLKEGDFVATVRFIPDTKHTPRIKLQIVRGRGNAHHILVPEEFSSELCRFLGYLLGDGHVYIKKERGIYNIVFSNTEQALIDDYCNCCAKVFSLTPIIKRYEKREGTIIRASIRSIELFRFLSQVAPPLLRQSRFREVPQKVMLCKNDLLASFLKAFFDCEAAVHPQNREIDVYSSSKKLLQQVQFLLCRFGIRSQLHPAVCDRNARIERTFKALISGENIRQYHTYIGFSSLGKSGKLEKLLKMEIKSRPHIDVIPNVSHLFKNIRQKLRLSQRDVRRSIGHYGYFEMGQGNPHVFGVKQIVDVFGSRLKEIRLVGQQLKEPEWSKITRVRKSLRISEQEIADLMGVSRSLVRYYRCNQSKQYSKKFLDKIISTINNLCSQILSDKILNEDLSKLEMLVNSDFFWDKITQIKLLKRKNQWVYDMRIQNAQRFIANTFLVHNSQWYENGEIYSPERLARAVERLRKGGCRNANLVGGEPTPWLQQWLETFRHVNVNVPVVWNSNSFYSEETAKLLAGFVDVYLLDFKYGPGDCAKRISDAPHYWEACTRNHLYGEKYGELLIRVLVLPEHLDCCAKVILNWIAQNLGTWVRTNVMFQYRPEWRSHEIPELRRRLTRNEMEQAIQIAKEAGLTNFIT